MKNLVFYKPNKGTLFSNKRHLLSNKSQLYLNLKSASIAFSLFPVTLYPPTYAYGSSPFLIDMFILVISIWLAFISF